MGEHSKKQFIQEVGTRWFSQVAIDLLSSEYLCDGDHHSVPGTTFN